MIFTEVIPQMMPDIDFGKLVKLSAIVRHKDRFKVYEALVTGLRKIQWVKLAGIKAIAIEQDIRKEMKTDALLLDPLGQIDHSLCTTDCVIHTKSALDSMAIFLTDLLELNVKGSERDLKKHEFRQQVIEKDPFIGKVIRQLEPWLVDLQDVRDEWIHRTSVRPFIVVGASEVGFLPIPKKKALGKELYKPINSKNFWSTEEYVRYHYSKLVTLFKAIVERSIQIEKSDLGGPTPLHDRTEEKMIIFPTRLTEKRTIRKMGIMSVNLSAYFKRLSELFK